MLWNILTWTFALLNSLLAGCSESGNPVNAKIFISIVNLLHDCFGKKCKEARGAQHAGVYCMTSSGALKKVCTTGFAADAAAVQGVTAKRASKANAAARGLQVRRHHC